jgi:hypothetical protein
VLVRPVKDRLAGWWQLYARVASSWAPSCSTMQALQTAEQASVGQARLLPTAAATTATGIGVVWCVLPLH